MHELILIKVCVWAFDVIIDRDAGTTAAAFAFCIHNILRKIPCVCIDFFVIDFIFRLKKKPFDNKLLSMPLANSGILDMFTFIKILKKLLFILFTGSVQSNQKCVKLRSYWQSYFWSTMIYLLQGRYRPALINNKVKYMN